MNVPRSKLTPYRVRILVALFCYWLAGTVLGVWGSRALGSGANWVGALFALILSFCVMTWRTQRPLWQRVMVVPIGLILVTFLGIPFVRWLMSIGSTGYSDPMIERGTLIAATSPIVAWAMMQSRVFARMAERE